MEFSGKEARRQVYPERDRLALFSGLAAIGGSFRWEPLKPGFLEYLGGDGKILAETRFLVLSRGGSDRMESIEKRSSRSFGV